VSPEPELREEGLERALNERAGEVARDVARGVRGQALADRVETLDLAETLLPQEPLQAVGRVAELADPVRVGGLASGEAMGPGPLRQEDPSAGPEGATGACEHEVGTRGVVQRVVEEARVEAVAEVELLHVAH